MSTQKLPMEARMRGVDYSLLDNDYLRSRGLATRPDNTRSSGYLKMRCSGFGINPVLNLITVDSNKDDISRVVSNIKHLLSSSTDEDEALSLYFSFLCLQLKNLKGKILESVEIWYDVKETPWNTSIWAKKLRDEGPAKLKKPELLVVLGQLLLLPFTKNTAEGYVVFMSRKTNDLCSLIEGARKNETGLTPMVTQTASRLGSILHALRDFKIAIIDMIVDPEYSGKGRMAIMLSYLGEQLRWNDMPVFVAIRDELVLTASPLLRVRLLMAEWENFYMAVLNVSQYKYPEYFSIVADDYELGVLYKSNFPTLAAIAKVSARMKTSTSAQVAGLRNQFTPLVESFFQMHRGIIDAPTETKVAAFIKMLPRLVAEITPTGRQGRENPATVTSILHENRCKRPRITSPKRE